VSLLALGAGMAARAPAQPPAGPADRPNFIVVETDDQRVAAFTHKAMPFTRRKIARHGTLFTRAITTSPFCCPSRAGFLTGSYTHNHGAWNSYVDFKKPKHTLAAWLQRDGYRTAMVGKYLNHYGKAVRPETRPEDGWDQWRMLLSPLTYYDYDVSVNGRRVHKGDERSAYQTTYLNRVAAGLVENWAERAAPFFLWLTPHAPHGESGGPGRGCNGRALPARGDRDLYRNAELPRSPSFNERDMSDKPRFMRRLPRLDRDALQDLEQDYRCRMASLREVDRGVKLLHHTLDAAGELDDTVIVFTSDNGLFEGEHRLTAGKRLPYREAVAVPTAALFGSDVVADPPDRVATPVANIDLAPTFLELAGATPCRTPVNCRRMDGRSLLPLLTGTGTWPDDRGLRIEMRNCRYEGLETSGWVYVKHSTTPRRPGLAGGCRKRVAYESYNLDLDRFELRNRGRGGAPADLAERMRDLRDCTGIAGREPPPPPGSVYCE
jgi:arylsulfatase A-like enzyme